MSPVINANLAPIESLTRAVIVDYSFINFFPFSASSIFRLSQHKRNERKWRITEKVTQNISCFMNHQQDCWTLLKWNPCRLWSWFLLWISSWPLFFIFSELFVVHLSTSKLVKNSLRFAKKLITGFNINSRTALNVFWFFASDSINKWLIEELKKELHNDDVITPTKEFY